MKSGILREDEGYDLLVNGADRTFRDEKENAYAAARVLKRANRGCIIEIRDRSTGVKVIMGEDGRTLQRLSVLACFAPVVAGFENSSGLL